MDEAPETGPDPLVALNFFVHRDFRRRFKLLAVNADITQKELLHRAVEAWEEKQAAGGEAEP